MIKEINPIIPVFSCSDQLLGAFTLNIWDDIWLPPISSKATTKESIPLVN